MLVVLHSCKFCIDPNVTDVEITWNISSEAFVTEHSNLVVNGVPMASGFTLSKDRHVACSREKSWAMTVVAPRRKPYGDAAMRSTRIGISG